MHGLRSTERVAAIPFWGHDAGAPGESRIAQSAEAPFARGFPAASSAVAGWLGYRGESSRARSKGFIPDAGRAGLKAFSEPPSSGGFRGVWCQVKFITLGLIKFYQAFLSPLVPSSCRFYPTCSVYAYEAVERWGIRRGFGLALGRLLRCRPYGGRGFDPVP
jgi:hypothetical protein